MRSKGITQCMILALAAVFAIAVLLPAIASAVQSPAGCNANTLNLTLSRSTSNAVPGQTVTFGVTVAVPAADGAGVPACDTNNVTITAQCPDANNNIPPTTTVQTLVTGANYPAGTAPMSVGAINCIMPVVTVNKAISANSTADGLLLDTDLLPGSAFTRSNQITVTVTPCKVLIDKQVSCDGGVNWVDPGLVTNNNDGTLDCSVLGVTGPVLVRYQARNDSTSCPLSSCVMTESNSTLGTPIVPGGAILANTTTDFFSSPNTPIACNTAYGDPGSPNEPDTATITCQTGGGQGSPVMASDMASFSCTPICGDCSINQTSETCDKGGTCGSAVFPAGTPAGTVCRADCTFCGDGITQTGEACDYNNQSDPITAAGHCSTTCTVLPFCGDCNINQTSETCDKGGTCGSAVFPAGTPAGTVCRADCTFCGDGVLQSGETCEPPNTATCDANCQPIVVQTSACRMTGGHNNQPKEANAAYDNSITKITTGGQIGAPNEGGCCTEPPQKAKCIINPNTLKGTCNGGINSPLNNPDLDPEFFCQTDSECPATNGSGSICPWGDWEHNHHYGPDDSFLASSTQGISGGMFAFHSGTAASPKESFIKNVQCDDPGWCVQARPAPDKQIFWEGTGVFHNMKVKNEYKALPNFNACGINQPVTWSQGNRNKNAPAATIHYYKAHVGDFGEPAGQRQKPIDSCSLKEAPMGDWSMSCTEGLSGVELIDAETNAVKTALHPLCLAQDCSECPDWYDIEIHCGATAASPVAYTFKHFILQGNFQLHPAVTESCNYRCNGACEPGVLPDLHEECNDVSCDMYCAGFGGCCDCCDPCLD